MSNQPASAPVLPLRRTGGHPIRRRLGPTEPIQIVSDDHDLKLFALSFTAFFICIYTLIG